MSTFTELIDTSALVSELAPPVRGSIASLLRSVLASLPDAATADPADLVRAIPLPDVALRGGAAHGVAYILPCNTPVSVLAEERPRLLHAPSAVSYYEIAPSASDKLTGLLEATVALINSSRFVDNTHDPDTSAQLGADETSGARLVLSGTDAGVWVVDRQAPGECEPAIGLVVRGHSAAGEAALRSAIADSPDLTLSGLVDAPAYKAASTAGDAARDAIAYTIARATGSKLTTRREAGRTLATPTNVLRYDYVGKTPGDQYVLYDGAYSLVNLGARGANRAVGVPVWVEPTRQLLFYPLLEGSLTNMNAQPNKRAVADADAAYAFPMRTPPAAGWEARGEAGELAPCGLPDHVSKCANALTVAPALRPDSYNTAALRAAAWSTSLTRLGYNPHLPPHIMRVHHARLAGLRAVALSKTAVITAHINAAPGDVVSLPHSLIGATWSRLFASSPGELRAIGLGSLTPDEADDSRYVLSKEAARGLLRLTGNE